MCAFFFCFLLPTTTSGGRLILCMRLCVVDVYVCVCVCGVRVFFVFFVPMTASAGRLVLCMRVCVVVVYMCVRVCFFFNLLSERPYPSVV